MESSQAMQWSAILPAFIALIGVGLGALLNHRSAVRAAQNRTQTEKAVEAYTAYLSAIYDQVYASIKKEDSGPYSLARVETKSRVALYGNSKVIASAAHFEQVRKEHSEPTEEGVDAFVSVIQAMRTHVTRGQANPKDLEHLFEFAPPR